MNNTQPDLLAIGGAEDTTLDQGDEFFEVSLCNSRTRWHRFYRYRFHMKKLKGKSKGEDNHFDGEDSSRV